MQVLMNLGIFLLAEVLSILCKPAYMNAFIEGEVALIRSVRNQHDKELTSEWKKGNDTILDSRCGLIVHLYY